MNGSKAKILVVTVGLGGGDVEASLLTPIEKSLRTAVWDEIHLLPSAATAEYAELLRARCPDLPIRVEEALAPGHEQHPDECFAVYDEFFRGLMRERPGGSVTADFTRGTKVMSAALALAAAGHGVETLRYVSGERHGGPLVLAGTEIVLDVRTELVLARKQLSLGRDLLRRLQYDAAGEVLPGEDTNVALKPPLKDEIACLRFASGFLGAWDRFDYSAALSQLEREPALWSADLACFRPTDAQREHLRILEKGLPAGIKREKTQAPLPAEDPRWAEASLFCWRLAVDVLESARRRFQVGALEDAFLRCYRTLELMGQAELFSIGLDSKDVNQSDPRVQQYLAHREKNKDPIYPKNGRLEFARDNVARFLKRVNPELSVALRQEAGAGSLPSVKRNESVLIHGFDAKATDARRADLLATIERTERLLQRWLPETCGDLRGCRMFPKL